MTATQLRDRRYRPVDPTSRLGEATDALYAAFADIPFDPDQYRCPHCVSELDVAAMGGDVAALDPGLLARFLLKAGTTWGGAAEFRRVVPRALELIAAHQLPICRAVFWDLMDQARWRAWPPARVAAIRAFLLAEWARLVRAEPRNGHRAHVLLADLAATGDPLAPYLDDWHNALGPLTARPHQEAAILHLVGLLTNSPLRPDVPDTVADVVPGDANAAALREWLVNPATNLELQRGSEVFAGTRHARRVALAGERLLRFRLAVERAAT